MIGTNDKSAPKLRDNPELKVVRDWWQTEIIDVEQGSVQLRGYPIEQLIGRLSFIQTIWLLVRGGIPTDAQARLLEAAMVASVNGGPMSPSCAIASMAITCGVGLNSAIASGVNALGDTHGGTGQQCMEMFDRILARMKASTNLTKAVDDELDAFFEQGAKFVPGYGHRFHDVDPRAQRMLALVDEARTAGTVAGTYAEVGREVEKSLGRRKGKPLPINVDGGFGVILAELGFDAPLGRGIFVLARSVGLLAHAWENMQEGRRIKGPVPPQVMFTYVGPPRRDLAE